MSVGVTLVFAGSLIVKEVCLIVSGLWAQAEEHCPHSSPFGKKSS